MQALSASDVLAIAEATGRLGMSPVGLAGRVAGLGADEHRIAPPWGWYGAVFVLGVGIGAAALKWAEPRLG